MSKVVPVLLSGGSGTRLWPMSRSHYPKQFLPLRSHLSLLQEAASRCADTNLFAPPMVICNEVHRFLVREQLSDVDAHAQQIVLEPVGRNTAAAAATAALLLADHVPDAILGLFPSDHVIDDTPAFHQAVATAAAAAAAGHLITFGVRPTHPETGYGYIKAGARLSVEDVCAVDRFVEKPDLEGAQRFLASGEYTWNSGMFVASAERMLLEMSRHCPEVVDACRAAIEHATEDLGYLRLDPDAFGQAPSISLDYAVMERTDRAAVVPVSFPWNDVGSWSALAGVEPADAAGNTLHGDVIAVDSRSSYVRSEGPLVATVGVEDLVVVAMDDAVLIAPKDRAQDVKMVTERLRAESRSELLHQRRVYRPWGYYQTLHLGTRFQVKEIVVKPGGRLSVQMHHHRAEHWVVVHGTAKVRRGEESILLQENQSIYIPLGMTHNLENPGKIPLHLIEVQSGSYLGEDDIVRFEDQYGRV